MVIVLLAWLYVIGVFAVAQTSVGGAFMVLIFLGVLPVMLMGWLLRLRRRQRFAREQSGKET
jgi:uncharacterized membrane protein